MIILFLLSSNLQYLFSHIHTSVINPRPPEPHKSPTASPMDHPPVLCLLTLVMKELSLLPSKVSPSTELPGSIPCLYSAHIPMILLSLSAAWKHAVMFPFFKTRQNKRKNSIISYTTYIPISHLSFLAKLVRSFYTGASDSVFVFSFTSKVLEIYWIQYQHSLVNVGYHVDAFRAFWGDTCSINLISDSCALGVLSTFYSFSP